MIKLLKLDHLVLTVTNLQVTCDFYQRVLGCEIIRYLSASGETRVALGIGHSQKINLHPAERPFLPAAQRPTPGSADICVLTSVPMDDVISHLSQLSVPIVEGPLRRTGTSGPILSVYIRDPDGNLLEIAQPLSSG